MLKTYMNAISRNTKLLVDGKEQDYQVTIYYEGIGKSQKDVLKEARNYSKKISKNKWIKIIKEEFLIDYRDFKKLSVKKMSSRISFENLGRANLYHDKSECKLCSKV